MTLTFTFKDGDREFSCPVQCQRCEERNKNGRRCRNRVCIGVPYCWQHLQSVHHLRIKDSEIPGAGKGLFASDPKKPEGVTIFKKGIVVTNYHGEPISLAERQRRYRDKTAPYGIAYNKNSNEDGACRRGVGTIANHKRGSNVSLNKQNHVFKLIAKRPIKNHEEITAYYGSPDKKEGYRFDEPTTYSTKRIYTGRRQRRRR